MKYNRIGRSGVQVSAVGLGTWNTFGVKVEKSAARRILFAARDAGINFLDTADTYANGEGETILGEFLRECNRDDFVVGTKLYFPTSSDPNDRGLSRKHIVCSVHRSLKRLHTEYIDLLQCHRFDAQTPLDETVMAMDDLVRQGTILYWGVSRFGEEEMVQCRDVAVSLGAHRPISNQFFYNLLERRIEQSTLPTCRSPGHWRHRLFAVGAGCSDGQIPDRPGLGRFEGRPPRDTQRHVAAQNRKRGRCPAIARGCR